MDEVYLLALKQVEGLGNKHIRSLVKEFGTAKAAWNASFDELAPILSEKTLAAFMKFRKENSVAPEKWMDICEKKNLRLCGINSEEYPKYLKEIFDPPAVFFYRGTLLPEEFAIAMVGARKCSSYGKQVATTIGRDLAAAGVVVVSGGARGIDTASHMGAVQTGRTIAVMGCGLDIVYPSENKRLFDEIAEKGAIISEFPPGTIPQTYNFPARNRIISGIARGTLVVEAAEKSGSLITAELANNEGRDVFAVPGTIYSDTSRGCNKLIQEGGAKLIMSAQDILDEYGFGVATGSRQVPVPDLSPEEGVIYNALSFDESISVDEIIYKTHGNISCVQMLLVQMLIKGVIEENEVHEYKRAGRM